MSALPPGSPQSASSSKLIRESEAAAVIAAIENPAMRVPIQLLTQALVDYHREHPDQLLGAFDLVFFVNVLKDRVEFISGLVSGTTPVEYWFDDYPRPDADESRVTPVGLRTGQAHNFAARQSDVRVQATLLALITRIFLKQVSNPDGSGIPAEAPVEPMDYLFMVKAVADALEPGRPTRMFIDGSASVA